jgi:TonB family protein
MYLIGDATLEERQHAEQCAACQARIAGLVTSLGHFRGAVRSWSERAGRDRAAGWTVIPATDHLERLLPAGLETPWYRSLWSNLCDFAMPARPPLDITSRPVLVKDIWGQYGRQKKSFVMSLAFQAAVVGMLVAAAATTKVGQQQIRQIGTLLVPPDIAAYEPKMAPKHDTMSGGGGGGDRSLLAASKGQRPKFALKQFTPPQQVIENPNARITMEPTLIGPPELNAVLPNNNMAQWGDPLAKLGPPSNGPGSGGGIGSGKGGGIGSGDGGGLGPGEGGGIGGGVYRIGGGVSAPSLLYKVEPEYSEEARKAKYQGTVLLYVEVDPSGHATNIRVARSLGLGLDEKAIEAVKKWKFAPGKKDGRPVTVAATIEVNFRLL